MPSLPPPPIPQKLCEMLRDYPEHIARLQDVLNGYAKKPFKLMPFDGAIWALEGRLETFISEARKEHQAAEASGDAAAIVRAAEEISLMRRAHSSNGGMRDLHALRMYFDANKRAFE